MSTKLRIKNIVKNLLNSLHNYETNYLKTWYHGKMDKKFFIDVNTYCMFVGTARSGHTLIASLIDAHPNAIISNELNTLKFVLKGFGKYQLFSMILNNSKKHEEQGKSWTGYSYYVENQMQGAFTRLSVIGDKKGDISTKIFKENPELIEKIKKKWNIELKIIHVIRNPYDVISSMARGGNIRNMTVDKNRLNEKIHHFFRRMETVKHLKTQFEGSILDIRHERFIKNPKENLAQILSFLNLNTNKNYLEDCSKIVNSSPSLSRKIIEWPESNIEWVKNESMKYPFLAGYSFEEE